MCLPLLDFEEKLLQQRQLPAQQYSQNVDVNVEWMYELRQSPLCPPQTHDYDLHSNDTTKLLVYYSKCRLKCNKEITKIACVVSRKVSRYFWYRDIW